MTYVWVDVLPAQVADDVAINALGNFVETLDTRATALENATNGPRGRVGGKRWTTAGTLASGLATAEALTGMDTGSITLQPGRSQYFKVRFLYIPSAGGTDDWQLRVRRNSLTGTQYGEHVFRTVQSGFGMSAEFTVDIPDPGVAITDTWVLTCQRLAGTDTLSITKSTTNPAYVLLIDDGPISRTTAL